MNTETCKTCGKKVILAAASNSEVRRVACLWKENICLCPDNNSPADIKIILNALVKPTVKP